MLNETIFHGMPLSRLALLVSGALCYFAMACGHNAGVGGNYDSKDTADEVLVSEMLYAEQHSDEDGIGEEMRKDGGIRPTYVRIPYDAGYGNSIALRGSGRGLSWDADYPCVWQANNIWECRLPKLDRAVDCKAVFVDKLGHRQWSFGKNHRINPKAEHDITAWFFAHSGSLVEDEVEGRKLWIYLPPSYDELGTHDNEYPVLIMQDGQNLFNPEAPYGGWKMKESLDDLMTRGVIAGQPVGNIYEFIVLAVESTQTRDIDYTPTNASTWGCDADFDTCGGGADGYLDFLENVLMPYMRAHYRVADAKLGIAGASFGGLLSLYACWTHPDLFQHCGAMSPSLWWDNYWIVDYIKANADVLMQALYIDAGSKADGANASCALANWLHQHSPQLAYARNMWGLVGQGHGHNGQAWSERVAWMLYGLYARSTQKHHFSGIPEGFIHCNDYK